MRAVPPDLDPAVVDQVDARLDGVAAEHGVRIPWAIESGSRAWGFPSPDSDYDCRFVYVRPAKAYLSLWPERDVIETPLDPVLDVNGWDLAKTVRLMVKGNAVAIEWLRSPVVYRGEPDFREALLALATEVTERSAVGRHYLHVAREQQTGKATLKRFLYVLRTTAALRWLDDHPGAVVPPMDLPTLLRESDVDDLVRQEAADLIALKARTREMGTAPAPAVLQEFVATQLARSAHFDTDAPALSPELARQRADDVFTGLVATWG